MRHKKRGLLKPQTQIIGVTYPMTTSNASLKNALKEKIIYVSKISDFRYRSLIFKFKTKNHHTRLIALYLIDQQEGFICSNSRISSELNIKRDYVTRCKNELFDIGFLKKTGKYTKFGDEYLFAREDFWHLFVSQNNMDTDCTPCQSTMPLYRGTIHKCPAPKHGHPPAPKHGHQPTNNHACVKLNVSDSIKASILLKESDAPAKIALPAYHLLEKLFNDFHKKQLPSRTESFDKSIEILRKTYQKPIKLLLTHASKKAWDRRKNPKDTYCYNQIFNLFAGRVNKQFWDEVQKMPTDTEPIDE